MSDGDPYDLGRFVRAQDEGDTYRHALAELRRGAKATHWMWFVFPQVAGLGQSPTARRYAISSAAEATAYLRHPILGPRLVTCATTVAALEGRTAVEIFGPVDAAKLRSSMTLFHRVAPEVPAFRQVLDRHFAGATDPATDERL